MVFWTDYSTVIKNKEKFAQRKRLINTAKEWLSGVKLPHETWRNFFKCCRLIKHQNATLIWWYKWDCFYDIINGLTMGEISPDVVAAIVNKAWYATMNVLQIRVEYTDNVTHSVSRSSTTQSYSLSGLIGRINWYTIGLLAFICLFSSIRKRHIE
jgi:hypothetical protein